MVEQIKIMDACTILGGAEGQLHAVLLRSNSISTEVTKRLYSEGGLIIAGPRRRNKKNSPPVNGSWAPFQDDGLKCSIPKFKILMEEVVLDMSKTTTKFYHKTHQYHGKAWTMISSPMAAKVCTRFTLYAVMNKSSFTSIMDTDIATDKALFDKE